MLKDRYFKWVLIVLLAVVHACFLIPFFVDSPAVLLAFPYSFFISFWLVNGSIFLHAKSRNRFSAKSPLTKIILTIFCALLCAAILLVPSYLLYEILVFSRFNLTSFLKSMLVSGVIITIYTLVYEVLFLGKEKELDSRVVKTLDQELQTAEVHLLKNELDPHFVYNSLMPLYCLIKKDPQQAESFAFRLMQVFQHFLQNRKKDYISLEEELQFINHYFFLLTIRFKDAVSINIDVADKDDYSVIPQTLQLLVENAIKHTEFNTEKPLHIQIKKQDDYLVVSNRFCATKDVQYTTKIGLQNLRARYKLLAKKKIHVFRDPENFVVKIPLIRKQAYNDVSSHYRG